MLFYSKIAIAYNQQNSDNGNHRKQTNKRGLENGKL